MAECEGSRHHDESLHVEGHPMPRVSVSRPLPPRPRALGDLELSRVFGGCLHLGEFCMSDKDCCDGGNTLTCASDYCAASHRVD